MKKTFVVILSVIALVFAVSCTSNSSNSNLEKAFDRLFNRHRQNLILDGAKTYTVSRGDSLTAITGREYGTARAIYFPVIMLASSGDVTITDPDLIEPGMKLTIPDLDKNLNDAKARASIKSYLKDVADLFGQKGDEKRKNDLIKLSDSL
jgi:hypothetical protein